MNISLNLDRWSEVSTGWLVIARCTMFLALAWGIHAALAGRNPRWRVGLWRWSAVGLVAVAVFASMPPMLRWRMPPERRPASAAGFALQAPAPVAEPRLTFPETAPPAAGSPVPTPLELEPVPGPAAIATLDPPGKRGPSPLANQTLLSGSPRVTPFSMLVSMWAAVVLVRIVCWMFEVWRLRRIIARARPARIDVQERCAAIASRLGLTRRFEVATSAAVLTPCVARAWRPILLLPENLAADGGDLIAIFGHELAHIRGRDLAWNHTIRAVATLLWFHPFSWRMRLAHASACDAVSDAVAADAVGDVAAYSRTLARLAIQTVPRSAQIIGLAMARKADVRRRIEFLHRHVFPSPLPWRLVMPALLTLIFSVVVIGGLGITRADAPPAPVEAAPKAPNPPIRKVLRDVELVPVAIQGTARDQDGQPVANATIQVVNTNPIGWRHPVLGTTTSAADGKFRFRDVLLPVLTPSRSAVPKPTESRFEVAGWADGKAFAWHPSQSYRPVPRSEKIEPPAAGEVFFQGETITSDLVFHPPARVHGTITDDAGRPVAGARVEVGFIHSTRTAEGYGMWNCALINPDGGEDLAFDGVAQLPESRRSALSDARGRYTIEGLPREAKFLALIDYKPTYEPHAFSLATSSRPFQGVLSAGPEGTVDHVFIVPREVAIRATLSPHGRPAAGATVIARGTDIQRAGAIARANAEGVAVLQLPPGDYTLRAEPPSGALAMVSETPLKVASEEPNSLEIALPSAAMVTFEAVDEATGAGVPGVGFEYETDTTRVRQPVSSQTVFVDHPRTGPDGRLAVVMAPGVRRFAPVRLLKLEPVQTESPMLTLAAGTPETVRFHFKTAADPGPPTPPATDETTRRLQERWIAQEALVSHGRAIATRIYQDGDQIDTTRFLAMMQAFDPELVPPVLERIHEAFPDADQPSEVKLSLIVDEPRSREHWGDARGEIFVFNGKETVRYAPSNAQVDISDYSKSSGFRLHVPNLRDFVRIGRQEEAIVAREGGKVTFERKSDNTVFRLVVDETTGFVYRESFRSGGGKSGREYWGFAPSITPQGLPVPGLSVDFNINQNKIDAIWIKRIESIDLKTPIPADAFTVATPAGVQILDYRDGRDDTYRGVPRAPLTDVLMRANEIRATRRLFVPPVKPGDPAPTINPEAWFDQTGKIAAPKLAGKVVVVDFWGISCGACVAQLPEVRAAADHFRGTDLLILGLHESGGTVAEVADFAARRGITYLLATDRAASESGWFGASFAAYGIRGIPAAAVLDRNGKVVYVGQFREAIEEAAKLLKQP